MSSAATQRPSDRAFGLVFGTLFAAIAAVTWLWSGRVLVGLVATSGILLSTAALAPGLLLPLNRLWMLLGRRIAVVTNHLLLGMFFFGLMTPMGAAMRLLRAGSFRKRPDPGATGYWTPVRRKATAENYADMF